MLVLTRKEGESLIIGDNIVVTVLAIRGGQVRLGIEAPKEIPVNRQEVYDRSENNEVKYSHRPIQFTPHGYALR